MEVEEAEEVRVWTTHDMAEHFGVPAGTVQKAAQRGSVPGATKSMGRWIFDPKVAVGWRSDSPLARETGKVKKGNLRAVGNRGGRPKREFELKFLRTLVDTVAPEDWSAIILKAVEQAKAGEWRARAWLSNYLIGVPVQRVVAQVDMTAKHEFETGERAAAIMSILNLVREREEANIVDVTPKEVSVDASA